MRKQNNKAIILGDPETGRIPKDTFMHIIQCESERIGVDLKNVEKELQDIYEVHNPYKDLEIDKESFKIHKDYPLSGREKRRIRRKKNRDKK